MLGHLLKYMLEYNAEKPKQGRKRFDSIVKTIHFPIFLLLIYASWTAEPEPMSTKQHGISWKLNQKVKTYSLLLLKKEQCYVGFFLLNVPFSIGFQINSKVSQNYSEFVRGPSPVGHGGSNKQIRTLSKLILPTKGWNFFVLRFFWGISPVTPGIQIHYNSSCAD